MTEANTKVDQAEPIGPSRTDEVRKPWVEPQFSAAQDALEVTMASAGTAGSAT